MRTQTTVTELNHEDIVNLLCTACYGSNFFDVTYKKSDYYDTPLYSDNDCLEDKWAKLLLNGKSIRVCDYYSEECVYGKLPHSWDKEAQCMRYTVTLQDIKDGLARALDSDTYIATYARHFAEEECVNFDQPEAEALLQFIVFGEEIYG